MAIKRSSKIDMNVGSASMTDMMFLLLIFLMIATTMVNNNALKVSLPESTTPTQEKPVVTVTITAASEYFVDDQAVSKGEIAERLSEKLGGVENPVLFLYADKKTPWEDVVFMMNLSRQCGYSMSAATTLE